MRLSRLHWYDLSKILQLQMPVRCHSCSERFYVNASTAWRIGLSGNPPRKRQRPAKAKPELILTKASEVKSPRPTGNGDLEGHI
jgi:hypothetical protein